MAPLPGERIQPLRDGLRIDLGGGRALEALHTPGHCKGHFAFYELATRALFCGDALGHFIEEAEYVYPASPAPEFDPEISLASADRLARLDPAILLFTHFGSSQRAAAIVRKFGEQVRRFLAMASGLEGEARRAEHLAELMFEDLPAVDASEVDLLRGILRVNAAGLLYYLDRSGGDSR